MCPALLHGLDFDGQACDFCAEMVKQAGRLQYQMTQYKPFTERAYCVACPECNAHPLEGCCAYGGRSCKLHSKREARANGLRATPRRGFFQRPKTPIQFNEAERQAFQLLGFPIPE
jgi:hypothetical protein